VARATYGGGDQHRLDAPPADQGVGVGERPRPDGLAHRPGPRRVDICHSDDAHLLQRRHRARMGAPHLAHADHPELERLHADVSLTGWSPWGTSPISNVSTKQAWRAQTAIAAHGGPRAQWRSDLWSAGPAPEACGEGIGASVPCQVLPGPPRRGDQEWRGEGGECRSGWKVCLPLPPISPPAEIVSGWARHGRVVTRAVRAPVRPATLWIRVVSMASARVIAGSIV
jgi:hypothetical protein